MPAVPKPRSGRGLSLAWFLCLTLTAVSAPAIDLIPDIFKNKEEGRAVFEGRDQYIRIVPQDPLPGGAAPPPNAHPATVDPAELADVLESISLWKEGGFFEGGDEELSLFSRSQATFLARNVANALGESRPTEDVTFAVVGLVKAFVVAKDKRSTAGRVFVADGKLNLIIGDMHREYVIGKELDPTGVEQGVDRRLYPHRPGRRAKAPRSMPARIIPTDGMELATNGAESRPDWLIIDLPVALAAAKKRALPDGVAEETERLKQEAAKLAVERRQMREEMARLRKQVERMGTDGGGNSLQSLEERLAKLDALRSKQLISEDEYRAKRSEILNDI